MYCFFKEKRKKTQIVYRKGSPRDRRRKRKRKMKKKEDEDDDEEEEERTNSAVKKT